MSYNVDSSEIIEQENFRLDAEIIKELKLAHYDGQLKLAEGNFMDLIDDKEFVTIAKNGDNIFNKGYFWWYGAFSGNSYDILVKEMLPKFKGKAKILFTWEGGDSHSGLIVEDGNVREGKVKIVIE